MEVLYVKKIILTLLVALSAYATDRPSDDSGERSAGPTVYGQLSVSLDRIRVE